MNVTRDFNSSDDGFNSNSSLDFDCKTVHSQSSASFSFLDSSEVSNRDHPESSQSSWTIHRSRSEKEDLPMMGRSGASMKNNKSVRELTINKLNYDAVNLFGILGVSDGLCFFYFCIAVDQALQVRLLPMLQHRLLFTFAQLSPRLWLRIMNSSFD